MRFSSLATALLALLLAAPLAAQERADYFTERSESVLGLDDFDYDSDWVPADSPIQVRLTAHAANTVFVEMDGEGLYDWDAGSLSFEGRQDGGELEIDVGLDVEAQVRFDILGYQWQGDLMDPFLYGIFESVLFDPYLLEGSPDRPAIIDAELPRETLADVPLGIDLIVASGALHIEIGGHVHAELEGVSITGETAEDSVVLTEDAAWAALAGDPELGLDADATLEARLRVEVTFLLYPSVVLTVLGSDYTLAEFEVPVELPEYDEAWVFDPVPLHFEPAPPSGDDDDGGGIQGDAGDDPNAGRASVSACGCSGASQRPAAPLLLCLGLLGLLGRRRRP